MRFDLRILLLFSLLATFGCQTAPHRDFDKIRVGMSKARVIELAGGPEKSMRFHSKDRWVYVFHHQDQVDEIREVHFDGGHVVFTGDRVTPLTSAEEQDKINEALNEQDRKRDAEEQERYESSVGIARVRSRERDDLDLKLNDSLYGTDLYKKSGREKLKTAPVFEPID